MEHTDIAVIGAGVLGCFAARALTAYDLHVTVLEAREAACTGITLANTGIVYTGCDTAPGTLKTELCVRANREFDALCRELDVRFSRCGSLMLAFGARAEGVLRRKLAAGRAAGVPGLRLLDRAETLALEPGVSGRVTMSLYAPGTGTVNPWELGLAAFENARRNGARFRFGEEVTRMTRRGRGFVLETPKGEYTARCVVNCAGLNAAAVRELTQLPSVRIFPTAGDYLVLDDTVSGAPRHVIFHEPEEKGKGLTLVPTVDGNVLLGPTERPRESAADWATAQSGLAQLRALCAEVVPALPLDAVIRSFSALRPNPFYVHAAAGQWVPEDRSISSFTLLEEDGLYSMIGIKTPGLTCAHVLGQRLAAMAAEHLGGVGPNRSFDPVRRAIPAVHAMDEASRRALAARCADFGEIVCHCRDVTRGEVLEAIRRGAVTLDGIKRRTGAGMGRCQGARCLMPLLQTLAEETGLRPEEVTKDGAGSAVVQQNGTL